eukprot:m.343397 g.343397  ORF g.343397 m.343397 type:complete len:310 (+) comp22787_c0_seq1:285-1214(+)
MATKEKLLLQPSVIEWDHIDKRKFFFYGPLLNFSVRAMLYPTKLIKTRMQVQTAVKNAAQSTVSGQFRSILRNEGVRALYKGFWPDSMGLLASQIYITSYEVLKSQLKPSVESEVLRNLLAGSFASMVSQTLMVPFEIVSQRQMVNRGESQTSAFKMARAVLARDGFFGLYRGYIASLLTFGPTSGIWWATYGFIRRFQIDRKSSPSAEWVIIAEQASAGALSGMVSAVSTNPLDIVRTRLQAERQNTSTGVKTNMTMYSAGSDLIKEEGVSGLLKGVRARMIHTSFSSMLLITVYECVKRFSVKPEYA